MPTLIAAHDRPDSHQAQGVEESLDREWVRRWQIDDLGLADAELPELQTLARLGAKLLDVSFCMVTVAAEDTVRVIAQCGSALRTLPRRHALCSRVVDSGQPLVVANLLDDPVFAANPFVADPAGIRFYAGYPIGVDPTVALGTICVVGYRHRSFSDEDLATLRELASLGSAILTKHKNGIYADRHVRELERHTETIQTQAAALASHKRIIEAAADLAKVGAWEVDIESQELRWSDGMYRIHGMNLDTKVVYGDHYEMYPEPHRSRLKRVVERARTQLGSFDIEIPARTPDGRRRWFRIAGGMQCESGRPVRWGGMKQDITQQKRLLERIQRLATQDTVTGLSNRAALMADLRRSRSPLLPQGLLLIDLDGFKRVNDIHGHQAGDACLKAVAQRLKRVCRTAVRISRLGGDEFAVAFAPGVEKEALEQFAQRVVSSMREPIQLQGMTVHIGASVGAAFAACSGDELYRRADLALYAAKDGGRCTWRVFQHSMNEAAETRFRQLEDIRGALDRRELEVFYQQKVRLADNRHEGFEALVRWRRPDGSIATPGEFAAALDDAELSLRIGDFVLKEVLCQARRWRQERVEFGRIAINLSPAQLLSDRLVSDVVAALRHAGLPPTVLEVEVTEGVFLDAHAGRVRRTLRALRRLGIKVALDDFGTGFASLSHLGQLQIDVLKVDRSFVSRLGRSAKETAIVQFVVQLAKALAIEIVAEGIESAAQAEFLRAIGCTFGQGYWFARPEDASTCAGLLRHQMPAVVWS